MNNGEKNPGVGECEPGKWYKKMGTKNTKSATHEIGIFYGWKISSLRLANFPVKEKSLAHRPPIHQPPPFIILPSTSIAQPPKNNAQPQKKTNRLRGGMNNCRWCSKFCRQKISPGVHPAFGQLQKTRPLASDDSLRTTPIFCYRWENVNCPFPHF